LLGTLQVQPPTPEEIVRSPKWQLQERLISDQMNPAILDLLKLGREPSEQWHLAKIADIATNVVQLAMLAERAKERAPEELKKKKSGLKPDHCLAAQLGLVFRATWRLEPKRSLGSPWVTFLKWGLQIAGAQCSMTDTNLVKLPTR
jgi:hypothetical protein